CSLGHCREQLFNGQLLDVSHHAAVLTTASGLPLQHGVGVHQTALYDFICTWAVWYLTVRVGTDFVRVDKRFFGLTGSQWSAAIFAAVAAIALIRWGVRERRGTGRPPPALAGAGSSTTVFTPP